MPTIINNPPGTTEDSGMGLVVGVILALVIVAGAVLFFMYGLPAIQNNPNPDNTNINVTLPPTTTPPVTQTPAK